MGATQPTPPEQSCEIDGVVKWYDQVRGYGFVVPDGGGADVLLHASCLRAFGAHGAREADRVSLAVSATERGMQATRVLALEPAAAPELEPAAEVETRPSDIAAAASPHGALSPARVKWFDKHKGFGFVNVFGDPRDIFVHMETVRCGGMPTLQPGEAVLVRTTRGPRGAMVSAIFDWTSVNLVDSSAEGNVARLKTGDDE